MARGWGAILKRPTGIELVRQLFYQAMVKQLSSMPAVPPLKNDMESL